VDPLKREQGEKTKETTKEEDRSKEKKKAKDERCGRREEELRYGEVKEER
jgi:hypothetical protein